ncbi:MAG: hypothetical protein HDS35_01090 [Bacteroides sp.]|nr:hypothetical protein [Bacteroides sp.]
MDTVTEALKEFLGNYTVAVVVIVLALVALGWWLSGKYHSMKNELGKMDDLPCSEHGDLLKEHLERLNKSDALLNQIATRLENLPCPIYSEKHDKHEERLNKSDALLHKMEGQLELLVNNSILKGTDKIRNHSGRTFSAKHSPRVLNENGITLLNDFSGHEFLEKHMDYFISKIEKLQPKTALDVENFALAVLQSATIDDMFNSIKNWIYNAPVREFKNPDGTTTEREISLDDIIFVLSLPIRDRYIETHNLLG